MAKIITKYIANCCLNLQLTNVYFFGNQRGIFQEKTREFYVINSRIFKHETVNYCLQSLSVRKYARAILSV